MDERVTVAEAAEMLGLSKEAVRKRISRGTLRSDKDPDGMVRVYVPSSTTESGTRQDELVEELRDRVRFLERELERRGDEADRYQRIVAGLAQANANLTEQVRELGPAVGRETGAESPAEAEEGRRPGPAREEAERASQRPWWRRIFGG